MNFWHVPLRQISGLSFSEMENRVVVVKGWLAMVGGRGGGVTVKGLT